MANGSSMFIPSACIAQRQLPDEFVSSDEILAIVGEDAGARGRRFVDSSAEGVVFEANS